MNIRETAKLNLNYCEFNREERNIAAVFFAALCIPGNSEKFLDLCGLDTQIGPDFGVYFEYAYLRDLWNQTKDESARRNILREGLPIADIEDILAMSTIEINRHFGVGGRPSKDKIQSPGRWSLSKFCENFENSEDILNICRFKWSFNIKPDIVVHLNKDEAICIEAKYESGEGVYPSSGVERAIFRDRGIGKVRQMELQKYLMEELLGVKTQFIFLGYNGRKSDTHKELTWAETFGQLEISTFPQFAKEIVSRASK